jgi:hypothetical protein
VITDEAAGEFIQALSVFFCFETVFGNNALFVKPKALKRYIYIITDKGELSFVQATEVRKDDYQSDSSCDNR